MLALQGQGCHNINLVTPTHYVPQIVKTLSVARDRGLTVPIVYNCGGYESIKAIRLLDGIVDIYMPDIKFLDPGLSMKYCRAEDYPEVVREVIREMYRQVGDLVVDERGIAKRGLLIRHLLMPGCLDDAKNILRFIKDEISADAYVNIMAQYHPCYRAGEFNELSAGISPGEYREALSFAGSIGLTRAATH
jgi:putative pyruvate formate lyase activating enzyme